MAQSKLETTRQSGDSQVEAQRVNILDAAETLFLRQGIENTQMVQIAAEAGITKFTLYRYFPNRDLIAFQVWQRMGRKIAALFDPTDVSAPLEGTRKLVHLLISNFEAMREVYRYFGMFDRLYLDSSPNSVVNEALPQGSFSRAWQQAIAEYGPSDSSAIPSAGSRRSAVIASATIWFLEKVALRGEDIAPGMDVTVAEQLGIFEDMVTTYIERLLGER